MLLDKMFWSAHLGFVNPMVQKLHELAAMAEAAMPSLLGSVSVLLVLDFVYRSPSNERREIYVFQFSFPDGSVKQVVCDFRQGEWKFHHPVFHVPRPMVNGEGHYVFPDGLVESLIAQ